MWCFWRVEPHCFISWPDAKLTGSRLPHGKMGLMPRGAPIRRTQIPEASYFASSSSFHAAIRSFSDSNSASVESRISIESMVSPCLILFTTS